MPEAQLVETRLVNLIHLQTVIASKAARVRLAAPGKGLIDFGLRRAHGAEAGLLAAPLHGIPVFGPMAHCFTPNRGQSPGSDPGL